MPTTDGQQPWDGEACRHQQSSGKTISEARDDVIAVWLMLYGDARPFVDWTLQGHQPGGPVLRLVAQMLHPTPRDAPYGQNLKFGFQRYEIEGGRGRRADPAVAERDRLVGASVADLMTRYGPGSYDAAIRDTAALSQLSERTVKRIYDEWAQRKKSNGDQ